MSNQKHLAEVKGAWLYRKRFTLKVVLFSYHFHVDLQSASFWFNLQNTKPAMHRSTSSIAAEDTVPMIMELNFFFSLLYVLWVHNGSPG